MEVPDFQWPVVKTCYKSAAQALVFAKVTEKNGFILPLV